MGDKQLGPTDCAVILSGTLDGLERITLIDFTPNNKQ